MSKTLQKKNKSVLEFEFNIKGVTVTQKLVFAQYLAVMLKSGLTISESLEIIVDQANGKFKKIVEKILFSIRSGNTLSSSLKKYPKVFSNLFVSATYAGEASGTLDENLNNIAKQLKEEKELVSKLKSAMVYPVIVLVATFFLGLAMAFLVLPKIVPLFEGLDMDLPWTTEVLISFSHAVEDHGWLIMGVVIFLIFSISWLVRQKFSQPLTHLLILKTPIVRHISKNANLARFCNTLGTLLKSGLNIDEALAITRDTLGNYYYRQTLAVVTERIGRGTRLSDNLEKYEKYYPRLVTSMVRVGEKSGNLEESLFYLAEFYSVEVDNSTKALSTAIEPILLIGIGLAVGGMAISIITPIYQITGNISG